MATVLYSPHDESLIYRPTFEGECSSDAYSSTFQDETNETVHVITDAMTPLQITQLLKRFDTRKKLAVLYASNGMPTPLEPYLEIKSDWVSVELRQPATASPHLLH